MGQWDRCWGDQHSHPNLDLPGPGKRTHMNNILSLRTYACICKEGTSPRRQGLKVGEPGLLHFRSSCRRGTGAGRRLAEGGRAARAGGGQGTHMVVRGMCDGGLGELTR
jgi:hypothetical protein